MAGSVLVILIVFDTDWPYVKQFEESAVYIQFGFLFTALIGYLVNHKQILLGSLFFIAILCYFLKDASSNNLQTPQENNQMKLAVAHVNVSSVEESYQTFFSQLKGENLDIISFQEIKPDWSVFLREELSTIYPYKAENVRIDPFGMAIYSKYPIVTVDTIFYEQVPGLEAMILLPDENKIRVFNTMLTPSIDNQLDELQDHQLKYLGSYLNQNQSTSLIMGDFNMVYWSSRIRDFRIKTGLKNSRRDVSSSVLSIPYDHIFHSPNLECTMFRDLVDSLGYRLGISANLQFIESYTAKYKL